MVLREISFDKFDEFAINHKYHSFYQSSFYALIAAEKGFDYEYIGMFDEYNNLLAASLILLKKIKRDIYYGYAPRGFLIDYSDELMVNIFSSLIKDYYSEKNVSFIKINPCVEIGTLNGKSFVKSKQYNFDYNLEKNGFLKLKSNIYFESSLPRFNGFINLEELDFKKFKKNTRNKIYKSIRKGLTFEFGNVDSLNIIEKMIKKNKSYCDIDLHAFYNSFGKNGLIDIFLIKIDYEQFLINARAGYDSELERNTFFNEKIAKYPSEKNVVQKMNSDLVLLSHKNDILEGTKGLREDKNDYIAAAIVVKYGDTVSVVLNTFDKMYSRQNANYYLYYQIMNYYKDNYKYLDLYGMSGDMNYGNDFYGLNRFKLGFNPNVYEYIGEFDLIIKPDIYAYLQETGTLAKEFNKKK